MKDLIPKYLKLHQHSAKARFKASEFFRRLSDYTSALHVLPSESATSHFEKMDESELLNQLQLVRILNLFGASARSSIVINSLPAKLKIRHCQQVVNILVSNYWYKDAIPWASHVETQSDLELSYMDRMLLISLADCYFGTGDKERAHDILNRVIRLSKEPPILGIAYRSRAAHLILDGRLDLAHSALNSSLSISPPLDQSNDRGLLEKWVGALNCLKGNTTLAIDHLSKAWQILFRPGTKPEVWLEVLFWLGFCKYKDHPSCVPIEWARLAAYPSPSNRMAAKIGDHFDLGDELVFGSNGLQTEPAEVLLDLFADVRSETGSSFENRHYSLGLGSINRLLFWLVVAGDYGLPQYRVYETLWPNEAFSLGQHQKRMEQHVIRLRKNGYQIKWDSSHLYLGSQPTSEVSCLWRRKPCVRGIPFLIGKTRFKREEVEEFFSISKRNAVYLIETWLKQSVVASGPRKGRSSDYQVLTLL